MSDNVVTVMTFKSVETILEVGGTQSWAMSRERAMGCKYAVVCRNASHPKVEGREAHHSAFMVGKVSDIVPSTETEGRWLILFSEYALVNVADQFEGRNPVRFWTTDDYSQDIDFDALDFKPMPNLKKRPVPKPVTAATATGISIAEAKVALSIRYEVDPSNIDIVIRG
ncbi:hypothetical protein HFN60_30915 [Rhizobium leguminosarum]|uniref:hypothetical protein n=1 Tax=Rhizobium leguminosarum TaxID=384 RepID=UPI001C98640F|nr:hypothetical protein [Rhizobium leguminosarum]MBY5820005.1 hypothetical protein [Rhizobium leguminosarum]